METRNQILISKPFGNGHLQIFLQSPTNVVPNGANVYVPAVSSEKFHDEILEENAVDEENFERGENIEHSEEENTNDTEDFSTKEDEYRQVFIQEEKFVPLDESEGVEFEEAENSELHEKNSTYKILRKIENNDKQTNYFRIVKSEVPDKTNPNYLETVGHVVGNIFGTNYAPEDNEARGRMEEVMKAAESLFSKRTRVLYHWMYPNSPKSKLKTIISTSWQNMGMAEKEIYISQVMGRFGFCRSNLMVNPQLGGMKNITPIPGRDGNPNFSTRELQNAISSIASDVPQAPNFPQNGKRKRLGRLPGSKNKKKRAEDSLELSGPSNQDFQDDPELSGELLQFALNLNNNIGIYK